MIEVDLSVLHIDLVRSQLRIKNILFKRACREKNGQLSHDLLQEILIIHSELTRRRNK